MTTILIIALAALALILAIIYAGFKIIMIPLRIAFFVVMTALRFIGNILRGLFTPLNKKQQ